MNKPILYLAIFGLGASLGFAGQEPKETETVFITKYKTRVVEKKDATPRTKPLPQSCKDVFTAVEQLDEPIHVMGSRSGELIGYASDLGKETHADDVPAINRITVNIRLAEDELGSAAIRAMKIQEQIESQYAICQQAIEDGE